MQQLRPRVVKIPDHAKEYYHITPSMDLRLHVCAVVHLLRKNNNYVTQMGWKKFHLRES